ncbi:hypothetical protein LF63_0101315 [Oleiagrimonas soli]|uniref:Uncharacterized protein n=1 Tax=Oleiagrimonas soli TaxID=1543381 RepID=A0A099CZN6_9GAMM|nr:hypothetical protein LF63_0101315 [Oleiagrimonas soli]
MLTGSHQEDAAVVRAFVHDQADVGVAAGRVELARDDVHRGVAGQVSGVRPVALHVGQRGGDGGRAHVAMA